MIKRMLMVAALAVGGLCVASEKSEAGIFYRPIGPVRRVAARTVLPPYPVARTVVTPVYGHVYRPVVAPVAPVYYGTPYFGSPYVYGGGVSVVVGF
jgi:hypothetical protein